MINLFRDKNVLIPSFFIYKKVFLIYLNLYFLVKNGGEALYNLYPSWDIFKKTKYYKLLMKNIKDDLIRQKQLFFKIYDACLENISVEN